MSAPFGWLRRRSALQRCVRKYAPMVAKFRRKYPDRPLRECLPGWAVATLRKLLPEDTYERDRLDEIISPDCSCDDPIEFCCRVVSLETGLVPEDGQRYLDQAECVRAELALLGVDERSLWLDYLRTTLGTNRETEPAKPEPLGDSVSADGKDLLRIPRHPTVGGWIGVTLFGVIALVCACFQFWTAALVLLLLSVAALLTSVGYWEFDRASGVLWQRRRSCVLVSQTSMRYPLKDLVAVILEQSRDGEGDWTYSVHVEFQRGQTVRVSEHCRDAERIARFLDVPRKVRDA
jgi:hypothetical protein